MSRRKSNRKTLTAMSKAYSERIEADNLDNKTVSTNQFTKKELCIIRDLLIEGVRLGNQKIDSLEQEWGEPDYVVFYEHHTHSSVEHRYEVSKGSLGGLRLREAR